MKVFRIGIVLLLLCVLTVSAGAQTTEAESAGGEESETTGIFVLQDAPTLSVHRGSELFTLYPAELHVDINGDGKTTSLDARRLLRFCADLESYGDAVYTADVNEDGKISTADARLVLRYSALLDRYYRMRDGQKTWGFYRMTDGRRCYFDKNGAITTGFRVIDGATYYLQAGIVSVGIHRIGGELCYFGDTGEGVEGGAIVDGKTLYFSAGRALSGFQNEVYYIDGAPAEGYLTVDGEQYFFENGVSFTGNKDTGGKTLYYSHGIPADGLTRVGEDTYCYAQGVRLYSWREVNGNYYFLDRSTGKMAVNTTVDGIAVGADGAAEKTAYATEKIKTFIKARNIVEQITSPYDTVAQKKAKCFDWVSSFPYYQYHFVGLESRYPGWEMLFANDIFDRHQGCCGSVSAAFAFLAVEAGCEDVYLCDDNDATEGHAWVTMEGNNRVYDIIFAKAYTYSGNYDAYVSDYRAWPPRKTYIGG